MDELKQLFDKQLDLALEISNKKNLSLYHAIQGHASEEEKLFWVQHVIDAMHNELEEVRNCFPWKTWKTYDDVFKQTGKKLIKEEVIDVFHFMLPPQSLNSSFIPAATRSA